MRTHLVTAPAPEIFLRAATPDDEPFLHALYGDRRAPELVAAGWGPDEARTFIDMQFRAQQAGYGATFPDADHWVVELGGEPIGRMLVRRRPEGDLVVDIVVHSRHRGLGIGTALMQEVIGDADAAGRGVSLTVAAHDRRVVEWYERLGFVVGEQHGPYLGMRWQPAAGDGR